MKNCIMFLALFCLSLCAFASAEACPSHGKNGRNARNGGGCPCGTSCPCGQQSRTVINQPNGKAGGCPNGQCPNGVCPVPQSKPQSKTPAKPTLTYPPSSGLPRYRASL